MYAEPKCTLSRNVRRDPLMAYGVGLEHSIRITHGQTWPPFVTKWAPKGREDGGGGSCVWKPRGLPLLVNPLGRSQLLVPTREEPSFCTSPLPPPPPLQEQHPCWSNSKYCFRIFGFMSYFALCKDPSPPCQSNSRCCLRQILGLSCCSRKWGGLTIPKQGHVHMTRHQKTTGSNPRWGISYHTNVEALECPC